MTITAPSVACRCSEAPFSREYARRLTPELARLPNACIHQPWRAGGRTTYPAPIVDHAEARDRALAAFGMSK